MFELNCISFTTDEIISIINWIETKDFSYIYKNVEDREKIEVGIAYSKKGWYYSLIKTDNIHVTKKYREYDEICPSEPTQSVTTVKEDENSIDENFEVFKKSNEEIASYFKCVNKEECKKNFKGALFSTFENYVSNDPEKFSKNISFFLYTDRICQNSLFKGLIVLSQNNFAF